MAGRDKASGKIKGIAKTADITYNEQAGAQKMLGPILGRLSYIGAANTQKSLDLGKLVAFFNNDTAVHFIKIGNGTLSAPTGPADGIPLPAGVYTILSMWTDRSFISDSLNVHAYLIEDDTMVDPNTTI